MPMPHILNPVNMIGPAFSDHLASLQVDSQVCSLSGADSAAVERGDADAQSESQNKQDAEPFLLKKELDDFLSSFHSLRSEYGM